MLKSDTVDWLLFFLNKINTDLIVSEGVSGSVMVSKLD